MEERRVRVALGLCGIGLFSLFGALVAIVFLWIAILVNIVTFWRISKAAGALLVPYILWVSFASILNFSVWMLNP